MILYTCIGQPSVLYYANSLFADVGLYSYASILVSCFKLVATLVATLTVDKYGRKQLLYIGCFFMLVALLALGTAFCFTYSTDGGFTAQKGIILISLFLYIGGYQIGFGPISWLMISEIFPLGKRKI